MSIANRESLRDAAIEVIAELRCETMPTAHFLPYLLTK
jgi:hypothetical protein